MGGNTTKDRSLFLTFNFSTRGILHSCNSFLSQVTVDYEALVGQLGSSAPKRGRGWVRLGSADLA